MDKNELTELNKYRYHAVHGVSDSDVVKVNELISLIEGARHGDTPKPTDGDIVVVKHPTKGGLYAHGHLEVNGSIGQCYENGMTVCTQPYVPFIHKNKDGTLGHTNASGGYWSSVDPEKLVFAGKQKKTFCDWGHCGACADGAISFNALVNVWEYTDEKFY